MLTEVSETPAASIFRVQEILQLKGPVTSGIRTLCTRSQRNISHKAVIFSCRDIEICEGKLWKMIFKFIPNVLETQLQKNITETPLYQQWRCTVQHLYRKTARVGHISSAFLFFVTSLLYHFPVGQLYFKTN